MKHGSFFNGVGGFQLAAEWIGWENVMSCEINKLLNQITKYYWPNCIQYEDIRDTDFTIYRNKIDIITGGFPCQPYSLAGKRKGTEDDRHLWPEMLRGIREIQPAYVVGENVFGLINWSGGLVFDEVQADLEAQGYEVFPFVLPACAVGAPHRRDRIWFVAHNTNARFESLRSERENPIHGFENATNTNGIGLRGESNGFGKSRFFGETNTPDDWQNFPTQSPVCGGDDGLPSQLDGITFSKWRQESIKAYGNAIVPKVALEIFKAINKTLDV